MGVVGREYRITGPERERALSRGLADATWFRPELDPGRLAELSVRTNARAGADSLLWVGLLVGSAVLAWMSLGTWWAIPAFALYGALYGGSADSRWHEAGHGTAFRTPWLNDLLYYPASFMLWREPTLWRWSHVRHHTDSIIVGRDAEIALPRPRTKLDLVLLFTHSLGAPRMLWRMIQHALGRIDDDARDLIPESDLGRLRREAQAFVAVLAAVVLWAVVTRSVVPLLFIGLPTIYGAWLFVFFGIMQHGGLREDVLDHRLNTRTVLMNPVFGFLYSNMNFHLEHHLFPSVPYRCLPALHAELRDQLPLPSPSCLAAYRELVPAVIRQGIDPAYEIERPLPAARAGSTVAHATLSSVAALGRDGFIDLGAVGGFSPGRSTRVEHGGCSYALHCLGSGGFALTDGTCTHGAAQLSEGTLLGDVIECPKHNGRFDVHTGEPLRRPVRVAIRTYPVIVDGGRLLADLSSVEAVLPDG